MAVVAVYNSKGGVGKSTFAINLAWESAQQGHRTLLWELDEQGDSSWMLSPDGWKKPTNANQFSLGSGNLFQQIHPSKFPGLSLLDGDPNIRSTENFLVAFSRQQQLSKLFAELEELFDVILLDCPPGFSEANRKVMLFTHLVVVPVIPSPLAVRGLTRIREFMTLHRGHHPPILPVFSMVDRRRKMHKLALDENQDWPIIDMASEIEQMSHRKLPIGAFAPASRNGLAFSRLWRGIERKLLDMVVLRTNSDS
ncbi:ParA family protein [Parasphingorhabdus sp.]|uniref:ParA family protein n=1 Tax=Parasphingorhabdus sp. TaxID=2709688 RepID=UPI0032ED4DA7